MNINTTQQIRPTLPQKQNTKAQKVTFGATPIYRLNLKEIGKNNAEQFIPAVFSRLDPNNIDDIKLISKLFKTWDKYCKYFEKIAKSFLNRELDYAFYMIEKEGTEPLENRVTSLMILDNPDRDRWSDKLILWYLQAGPGIANNKNTKIRGSGENMIYCAAQILNSIKEKYKALQIPSENNKFYEHLGFIKSKFIPLPEQNAYDLPTEMIPDFISKIEKKYKFQLQQIPLKEKPDEVARINNFRDFCGNLFW